MTDSQSSSSHSKYSHETQAFWTQHIQAYLESRLSRAAYCRTHNMDVHRFKYWHDKLHPAPIQGSDPQKTFDRSKLIAVKLTTDTKISALPSTPVLCTLTLKNGCLLNVCDQEALSHILDRWG